MSSCSNNYYKCTCGTKIKYTSLRNHLKTKKHDILYRSIYGVSNESLIIKMEALDSNKDKYSEGKYLEYCNILKHQWDYWSVENSKIRKWSYNRYNENVYISFKDAYNKTHSYALTKID
jgi:hypothetical protein